MARDQVWLSARVTAQRARSRFAGRNATVHSGRTVHAITDQPWIRGETMPAPLCRIGISGWSAEEALSPTVAPVNCGRCLQVIRRGQGSGLDDPMTGIGWAQPALFEVQEVA